MISPIRPPGLQRTLQMEAGCTSKSFIHQMFSPTSASNAAYAAAPKGSGCPDPTNVFRLPRRPHMISTQMFSASPEAPYDFLPNVFSKLNLSSTYDFLPQMFSIKLNLSSFKCFHPQMLSSN